MKDVTVVLFTVTNKNQFLSYGIYSLKAYVLKHLKYAPKPKIINKVFIRPDKKRIAEIILKNKPQIVGFSCTVKNSKLMLEISDLIKKKNRKITTIFGGPETYQNIFYNTKKIMTKEKSIDIITKYDGEEVFLELLECLIYGKKKISDIKGIIYRDGNKICINVERQAMDLSKIPSPYLINVLKINRSTKTALIENSRGCPYRCAYCSFPLGNYGYLRYFPIERVKKELIYLLKKKNIKFINIVDNNFNIYEERAKEILETITKHNTNNTTVSVFYNASKKIISSEMVELLSKSKMIITIGVQSTNPLALKVANRQANIHILGKNLKILDEHKIKYILEFIYGLPEDSYQNIRNNVNWIFRFNAIRVMFYRLAVLRGTYFHLHAKELGLDYEKIPQYVVRRTKTISQSHLEKIKKLLFVVSLFYNDLGLRKNIQQINKATRLDYINIFEELLHFDEQIRFDILSTKMIPVLLNKFMLYLYRKGKFKPEYITENLKP